MNIHRLEEDGGGGDKFEGPKPLHFKRLVRFLREGSEPKLLSRHLQAGELCPLDSASAVPLMAPPLPSHSGCPNLGPIIFPQDSFPAQAAG